MTGIDVLGLKDPNPGLSYTASHAHPYTSSSVSSSASSSSSSVFSLDGLSTQGSISSTSTNSVDVIWENDGEYPAAGRGLPSLHAPRERAACYLKVPQPDLPTHLPVAPELRKHPRRTSHLQGNNGTTRPPPCLMRQSERKVNFVDNLVGKSFFSNISLAFGRLAKLFFLFPFLGTKRHRFANR
ncbi:PHO85 cyclin-5 [Aspergillus melleus]|uniref:PHO85 cyclin-5 n=1 Tax=Aspergillus melleus TaxID=138277 RepID=UPI001E8DCAF3|nr:PHO85 cyclin-5 [Aspergillus melleus]KAH8431644.1 PHO85 cyclin-5 [Aspergillus melleus]